MDGWRGEGCCCCCCWMLLSYIPLTQVGDSSPAGGAPGQSGERDSHQSKTHLLYFPHKTFFLFKHHHHFFFFFFSGTQPCLALNTDALRVNVCERGLIPCYPKTFFPFFLNKKWISVEEESRVFSVFFLELVMSAAHDSGGFGPIFVYNTDTADFLLSSNFSIMCPLANSNYNSLVGI